MYSQPDKLHSLIKDHFVPKLKHWGKEAPTIDDLKHSVVLKLSRMQKRLEADQAYKKMIAEGRDPIEVFKGQLKVKFLIKAL